jgi:hypothetical protein
MDTYGHLYPDDDDSTREVIDTAFRASVDTVSTDDLAERDVARSDGF